MSSQERVDRQALDVGLDQGPDTPQLARRWVTSRLSMWDRDDLADAAALVVSVLVTNAALHGTPPIRLRMQRRDDGVRLEVADASPVVPQRVPSALMDTVGRGMTVVAALAARWGVERVGVGKVVWCDLTADGAAGMISLGEAIEEPDHGWPSVGADDARVDGWAASVPSWTVRVRDIPARLFCDSVRHLDERLRELRLIALRGAFPELVALSDRAGEAEGRAGYGRLRAQARAAASSERVDVEVVLPLAAAGSLMDLRAVHDVVDTYCRAQLLLALESPPAEVVFRRWLLEELAAGLRRAAGLGAPAARRFETALLEEIGRSPVEGKRARRSPRRPPHADLAARGTEVVVEARFESLLEAAPDAMVGVDRTGTIRLVNRQTELLFGYAREDLIGQSLETLIPESFREVHPAHREGYFANPGTRPMGAGLELSGRRRDGSEFPVDISLSSIDTEDGLLVTAAVRDITAWRAARESLRESRQIARMLQRSLLDVIPARIDQVEVAVRYQPATSSATVGGDWYHVFTIDDGLIGVSVGDVGGHGIEAAATMGKLKTSLAAIAGDELGTDVVLTKLNRMLCRLSTQYREPADAQADGVLATALYGRMDLPRLEFVYTVAGHPGPIIIDTAARTARHADPVPNLPLGVDADTDYHQARLRLPASGRLLVFTDGLYERRGISIQQSLDDLVTHAAQLAAHSVDDIADALLHAVSLTAPVRDDDLALVVLGW